MKRESRMKNVLKNLKKRFIPMRMEVKSRSKLWEPSLNSKLTGKNSITRSRSLSKRFLRRIGVKRRVTASWNLTSLLIQSLKTLFLRILKTYLKSSQSLLRNRSRFWKANKKKTSKSKRRRISKSRRRRLWKSRRRRLWKSRRRRLWKSRRRRILKRSRRRKNSKPSFLNSLQRSKKSKKISSLSKLRSKSWSILNSRSQRIRRN